jgi:selenocysteine lyase/cysteine desulfurase
MIDWSEVRIREFPAASASVTAFFDHAAVAPMTRRAAETLHHWTDAMAASGIAAVPRFEAELAQVRHGIARFLNVQPTEIAFTPNTTTGLGLVAAGFPWRPGDVVLVAAGDYPANIYPWQTLASRGVVTRALADPPSGRPRNRAWLETALDPRVRLVSLSLVDWLRGDALDLPAIADCCKSRGIALAIDAIQALPALTADLSATPVDFLACGGHKWLMGPQGSGFLYVNAAWHDRLKPLTVGALNVRTSYNAPAVHLALKSSADRYEEGTKPTGPLLALGASITLWLELGPGVVSNRILDRARQVANLARDAGWSTPREPTSGIVTLSECSLPSRVLLERAKEHQIALSIRRGKLRLSPHVWTSDHDLDRLARFFHAIRPGIAEPA